tara:strand:+ start:877 stop:2085 length:1209 start_codon:yes stop_codon:yes gene_type:complete
MIRFRLNPQEAESLGFDLKPTDKDGSNPKYTLTNEQATQLSKFRNIDRVVTEYSATDALGNTLSVEEVCELHKLDFSKVRRAKLVAHTKRKVYNIEFKFDPFDGVVTQDDMESMFKELMKDIGKTPKKLKKIKHSKTCDRLVITDVHVGMDPNPDGDDMYNMEWNEKILFKDLKAILNRVQVLKSSDTIIVEDLGDFLDGWSKQTTRGGHNLPQNMTNKGMFEVGLKFKLELLKHLSSLYKHVIMYQVGNDNHAGDFAAILNVAVKDMSSLMFDNVEVVNFTKFMEHYTIGAHANILSHGKDKIHMKNGMKPFMGPNESGKIHVYIDSMKLSKYNIRFAKGDSHQAVYDWTTSHRTIYCNYPAMSPGSGYVTTNFKPSLRGVMFETFELKTKNITTTPIWLN